MGLLTFFRKTSPPQPVPDEPGPLPPIVERTLCWSEPFSPVIIPTGDDAILALPLLNADEIRMCTFKNPDGAAAECAHMGLRVILLTSVANLRGELPPFTDDKRQELLRHVLTSTSKEVDRWNSALLFMHRTPGSREPWQRTGLAGISTTRVSRFIEAAELNLHLKLARGDIPTR